MLCTISVAAVTPEGETVATNFLQHFVNEGPLPTREQVDQTLILRQPVHQWSQQQWSSGTSAEEAERLGYCFGRGAGFFEWVMTDPALADLPGAMRIRVLCEVSARREDTPQTGVQRWPTQFECHINGLRVHREVLPDHPHDSRGALSYLRGGRGAYGYLMRATIEGELLAQVIAKDPTKLTLRCAVPDEAVPAGGLTVYGYDTGRFPVGPTVVVEWERNSA
jgi:hypothetical protein